MNFEIGDIVRLRTGYSPQMVVDIPDPQRLTTRYLSDRTGQYTRTRPFHRYIHMENPVKLYRVIDKPDTFGTLLARDSQGNLVLELKGSSGVITKRPDEVEEVRPYTVLVHVLNNSSSSHLEVEKGSVELHDLLFMPEAATFGVVVKLDTKHSSAQTRSFKKVQLV